MIAPSPIILPTLGWREMGRDAWAVSMERLNGEDREFGQESCALGGQLQHKDLPCKV